MKPSRAQERRIDLSARKLRSQGVPFAIATVVRTVDATSAKPGAKALVLADGTIAEGWVGGGCARGAIGRAAKAAIAAREAKFVSLRPAELLEAEGVEPGEEKAGARFARNGCPSKGSMDVFVEPVLPEPQLAICGDGPWPCHCRLRRPVGHAPGDDGPTDRLGRRDGGRGNAGCLCL